MHNLSLHDHRQLWRTRYDDLATWERLALERYAVALTHNIALIGATKIRLIATILNAEVDGWPRI